MPRLEARFHPWRSGDQSYVVVGHVVWDAANDHGRPRVEPAGSLRDAHAPSAILATLRHLVSRNAARCDRLTSLESRFWSFVVADDPDSQTESSPASAG